MIQGIVHNEAVLHSLGSERGIVEKPCELGILLKDMVWGVQLCLLRDMI